MKVISFVFELVLVPFTQRKEITARDKTANAHFLAAATKRVNVDH